MCRQNVRRYYIANISWHHRSARITWPFALTMTLSRPWMRAIYVQVWLLSSHFSRFLRYYRPTVTLCLKCTVFEIWRHIGRKSPKKPTPSHLARSFEVTPCEFFDDTYICHKVESWGYQRVNILRSCFRSARHNTGVWQASGRTDGQTRRCRKDPR